MFGLAAEEVAEKILKWIQNSQLIRCTVFVPAEDRAHGVCMNQFQKNQ